MQIPLHCTNNTLFPWRNPRKLVSSFVPSEDQDFYAELPTNGSEFWYWWRVAYTLHALLSFVCIQYHALTFSQTSHHFVLMLSIYSCMTTMLLYIKRKINLLGMKNELPMIACSSSCHSAMCHTHTWPRLGGHHAAFAKQLSQIQ